MNVPPLGERSISDEAVESMASTIGEMIINFAFIDQALDCFLMELFPVAVKRNIASKMPYQLGHKVELLEKCFLRMRELHNLKEEALSLLKEVSDYSWVRNTLAHGALSHYIEGPPAAFVFIRLGYDKQKGVHLGRDEILTLASIAQATKLSREAVPRSHELLSAVQAAELP